MRAWCKLLWDRFLPQTSSLPSGWQKFLHECVPVEGVEDRGTNRCYVVFSDRAHGVHGLVYVPQAGAEFYKIFLEMPKELLARHDRVQEMVGLGFGHLVVTVMKCPRWAGPRHLMFRAANLLLPYYERWSGLRAVWVAAATGAAVP